MAKAKTKTGPRFYMDSEAFCELWAQVLAGTVEGPRGTPPTDWKMFVMLCWDKFSADEDNQACLEDHKANSSYTNPLDSESKKYEFMNDRVYGKCRSIAKAFAELEPTPKIVELPSGWESRNGPRQRSRPSYEELAALFDS